MNNVISNILRFLLLIVLQVFVCNHINLFGFATPALYLLAPLLLPLELPLSAQYFIGFFTGFVVDMFTHTLGVNALACLVVMFVRPYLVKRLDSGKSTEGIIRPVPAVKDTKWIFFYIILLSLLHQVLVIVCNTVFTSFLLLCSLYLFYSAQSKY